ncbi:cation-independent mannose-6-phosphate receptor-like [Stylophora pistillata]|uniref:cation-independent mannose-6-phosphate receptor-like n=1 Tax=Stylophora pistillata TaxID=50429 RepID=UPI000C039F5C|nr:cation-independent mannose-6-phosphate receptor-like [Stylophora pistillata]
MAAEWRVFQLLACLFLLYGPHSHAKIPTKCPIPKDKPKYFISNWTWRITESNKQYYINVCGDINHRSCPNGAAVCSTSLDDKRPEELGTYKSLQINAIRDSGFDLIFPGKECNEMGNNKAWETNIFMRCGKTLGSPKFVDVFVGKEKCVAVFEFVTNEACTNKPGPEIPCSVYGSKNELIDLTPLIKTQGGHEVSSSDPTFAFYINVCRGITPQKDDKIGCKANSSMCRFNKNLLKADDVGSISYASNLRFHNGDVVLVYNTTVTVSGCPKHMNPVTTITFRCPGKNTGVRGPVLIGARYCAFEVLWETDYACPKHSVMETNSCVLSNEFVHFNLTKLTAAIRDDYRVYHNDTTKAGDTTQYIYYINVCHPLSFTCEDKLGSNSTVCQEVKDGSVRWSLGIISNQTLRYADGQLSLTYEHGSTCRNGLNRTTIIMFSCDPHAKIGTGPVFNSESYCFYYFDWKTRYACAPSRRTGTQCRVVSPLGVRYDLSELVRMENSTNWIAVDGESSSSNKKILMNVCGQVTGNPDAKQCDSSAAICMIDQSNGKVASLGRYIDPPTLNPDNSIKLVYLRGSECKKDNSGKSVFIRSTVTFVCQTGDLSSPPVLVTHSLDNCYYEFMWRTAAACSLGLNTGEDCRVEDKNAGYVFDLNPLANKTWHNKDFFNLTMKGSQYSYLLKVCGGSSRMDCGGTNVSACQIRRKDSKKFTLGLENKNLYYYDGMLNLTYQDGDKCHNGLPRTTHITFLCNQSAKDDGIGIPEFEKENHCTYNFRWFTKYACPPKIVECVARTDVAQYDLTSLVKTSDNWEATYKNKDNDKDKGKFYINVCRSLNLVPGCSVTAAVCLKKSNGKAINLGSVSNPPTEGVNNVVITYTDGEKCQGDKKYQTTITFLCKKGEESSSPEFIETADNGCTYKFNWITAAGCPIENVNGDNCIVHDPKSDTIFNLLPLRKKSNVAMYGGNVTENNDQATFQLNICGPLPDKACGDRGNISACLIRKNGQKIALGKKSMQLLYKGEIVTLIYRGGDNFETGEQREVHIKFYCNSKKPFGKPTFAEREEKSNKYIFEFQTSLVCSAKAVQCLVSDSGSGVEYDLSPMGLTKENWQAVDTRLQNKHLHYFINVCRAVNPIGEVLKCPGGAIGACQIDHSQDKGFNLGYVQSNPQITGKGELTLQYSGGTSCHKNQFSRSIRIVFSCSKLMGSPIFLAESPECEYLFSWETPSACPLTREVGHDCKVEDKQYGYMFNLSVLYSKSKDYNVNVKGGAPGERIILNVCNKLVGGPKGCIGEEVGACIIGARNTPVVLNKTLTYYNGQIQTTYGTKPAINITFECNQDTSGLDTGPTCEKKSNTYDCLWQTPFACRPMISVQCSFRDDDQDADNQYDYSSLSKSDGNWEAKVPPPNMDRVSFFINVCRTVLLKDAAKGCPPSSGVCMHKGGKYYNLGTIRHGPRKRENNIYLDYEDGEPCGVRNKNYTTHILMTCGEREGGVPMYIGYNTQTCEYDFLWTTSEACPLNDEKEVTFDNCTAINPHTNAWFDLNRLRNQSGDYDVVDKRGYSYKLNVCGPLVNLSKGCEKNSGVCQEGKQQMHSAGISNKRLHFDDGILYLNLSGGEPCHHVEKNRETIIQFVCSPTRDSRDMGKPVFISENDCTYFFVWHTPLVCERQYECAALQNGKDGSTVKYSLSRLMRTDANWEVISEGSTKGKDVASYYVNLCRPLLPMPGKNCPAGVWACKVWKNQEGTQYQVKCYLTRGSQSCVLIG